MLVKAVSFSQFLSKFPLIELPVLLNEESHHTFSTENSPLSEALIQQFIQPIEEAENDEFTEFIPCFQLPIQDDYHAMVYWRAGLMQYHYTLATFSKKGLFIDKRIIAGTFIRGEMITQSVATINESFEIFVASGQSHTQSDEYDATSSTAYELEIAPDGQIVNT